MLCALLLLLLWPKPQPKKAFLGSECREYYISDYTAVAARQEGKAYLTITTDQYVNDSGLFMYTFTFTESQGIPFTIRQFELVYFLVNDKVLVQTFSGADMSSSDNSTDLAANGSFTLEGGFPHNTGVSSIGILARGVDANGADLSFTAWQDVPQPKE